MSNTNTVINRAIGAGLFAAGVGLCVVLSDAAQPSLAVEACANNLCPSTIGSAFSVVEGEVVRVAIGDPQMASRRRLAGRGAMPGSVIASDGVSAPVGRAWKAMPESVIPADGVSAPHNQTPSDG